ncbi:hypothetical protein J6590_040388 [Homalodisca vitripennis]|nr:hypothetical protein J6590_040388 [Homalodisca vitripennis]
MGGCCAVLGWKITFISVIQGNQPSSSYRSSFPPLEALSLLLQFSPSTGAFALSLKFFSLLLKFSLFYWSSVSPNVPTRLYTILLQLSPSYYSLHPTGQKICLVAVPNNRIRDIDALERCPVVLTVARFMFLKDCEQNNK